jgi:ketosteroid isomerase-like protein
VSEENVEIVRRVFAEQPPPRLAVLEELAHPDIEWVTARDSLLVGSYRGYKGVQQFWEAIFSAWDEYTVELLELQAVGDQVAAITRMRGRTRGIEVEQTWSVLFTLRGGKISRVEGFSKAEGALEAAGRSE